MPCDICKARAAVWAKKGQPQNFMCPKCPEFEQTQINPEITAEFERSRQDDQTNKEIEAEMRRQN